MRIKVRYMMTFSQFAGRRSEELEVPRGTSLGDLVALLKKGKGREFARYLEGSVDEGTAAFAVNGSIARDDRRLNDGDEVMISHVVGGG